MSAIHNDRFDRKVFTEPNTGCWLWGGSLCSGGYGTFGGPERTESAHIYSYVRHRGPVPSGTELDHKCRTKACVNPDHMEAVTHRENVMRGKSPFATKAAATHCKSGHELSGHNLIRRKGGNRGCRVCGLVAAEKWQIANREGVRATARAQYHLHKNDPSYAVGRRGKKVTIQ